MKLFFSFFLSFVTIIACAQTQESVDFIRAEALITPQPKEKLINGVVTYKFKALEDIDFVFLDAVNMEFSSVLLNHKKVVFLNEDSKISIPHNFKKGKTYFITFKYTVKPKKAVYFIGWDTETTNGNIKNQIWTQGQGKYTSHWLPSFDDMTEKVEFDINLVFNENYTVIANGNLEDTIDNGDATKTWVYNMDKPMSSYLLAFAIGNYAYSKRVSASGVPMELYYYPKDSLKVEPTYRYSESIFNFYEEEIGIAYPWLNYKQIPVHDFLYAGMENTGTTIYSDNYVIDSTAFVDRNYVNINAHELAHQWFGNLVTEKDGNSHWLHEGFATYYSYLAEKDIFGEEHYYWKLYDSAEKLNKQQITQKGEALTNPKASSLTFYEKGAWALHMLREQVGDKAFKKGVANYLKEFQFKNVTISDFITEMEKASGTSLSTYESSWLNAKVFPYEEVQEHLSDKSKEIKILNFVKEEVVVASSSFSSKEKTIKAYWNKTESSALHSRMITQFSKFLSQEFLNEALLTKDIRVRQAIAKSTIKISPELKTGFISLLKDDSYSTNENALYALWSSFPEERGRYLDATDGLIGLPNKNIRLLWLTLAIVTSDYNSLRTAEYYKELVAYTSPSYSTEIRMGAFQFLKETIGLDNVSLKNLMRATSHHSWQFKKYSRNVLRELIKDEDLKNRVISLSKEFNEKENVYFNSILIK